LLVFACSWSNICSSLHYWKKSRGTMLICRMVEEVLAKEGLEDGVQPSPARWTSARRPGVKM
jgi:hypothetical protein